jgi:hypothetical protein
MESLFFGLYTEKIYEECITFTSTELNPERRLIREHDPYCRETTKKEHD